MKQHTHYSSGKTSTILLICAVILILMIAIVFAVVKVNSSKKPTTQTTITTTTENTNEPPPPLYETTMGDIRFVMLSAEDLGNVLKSKNASYQQDLTTTEKFIKVTMGAQNKGKINIQQGTWDVGNILDDAGRNFTSINDYAYNFLPYPNLCGALLKPEFEPTPCVKIYEVSKASTKLKIQVNWLAPNSSKKQEGFVDLNVQ